MRCAHCDHLFLNPRPRAKDLGIIYPPHYYSFADPPGGIVGRAQRVWEGSKVELYGELMGSGPKKVLDVGCGNGRFLSLLREFGAGDWRLVGVDFDDAAIEKCRKAGFEAHAERIEDLPENEDGFDAAIMLQLIEHVEDPVDTCRQIFSILKPGGHVIIETPNVGGADYALFKKRWWGHYHFPRHWNLFSAQSLERMLTDQGFEIERSEYLISTSAWIISHYNYFKDKGYPGWFYRLFSYKNPVLLGLAVTIDTIRTKLGLETSNQRVIGRKPA